MKGAISVWHRYGWNSPLHDQALLRQIEEDRAKAEATAELREEDYQLAYAIDILKGLSAFNPNGPSQ